MQRMGHQRLASAGFTVDQHVTIGLPQIKNIFAQPLHRGGLADQFFHQLPAIRQFAPQGAVVHHQTPRIGCLLGQFRHPVGVERLFQKIKRTYAHRFHGHRHITVAGDHNDRQSTVVAHQFLEKLHPVHARHLDVGNHNARIFGPQLLKRVFGTRKGFRVITRQRQPLADGLPHVLFVINDRDFHCLCHISIPPLPMRFVRPR